MDYYRNLDPIERRYEIDYNKRKFGIENPNHPNTVTSSDVMFFDHVILDPENTFHSSRRGKYEPWY